MQRSEIPVTLTIYVRATFDQRPEVSHVSAKRGDVDRTVSEMPR
jgi:hypothetical protein